MKKQIAVAIPVAESVQPVVMQTILTAVAYAAQHGVEVTDIGVTQREMIDRARNGLTEAFLGTSTEWLMWFDSDMTFPKETITQLFKVAEEKNAKMVSGIYYQRKGQNLPVLWSRGSETESGMISGEGNKKCETNKYVGSFMFPHPDKKEPFKAHAAGFGCVLVHRSVFEVMPRPWFRFVEGQCSEDFYFFVEAKEKGFELWIEPTLKLGHIGDAPIVTRDDFHKKLDVNKLTVDVLK